MAKAGDRVFEAQYRLAGLSSMLVANPMLSKGKASGNLPFMKDIIGRLSLFCLRLG